MCEIITRTGLVVIGDPSECPDVGINSSTKLMEQHQCGDELIEVGIVVEQPEELFPVITNWMRYRKRIEEKF